MQKKGYKPNLLGLLNSSIKYALLLVILLSTQISAANIKHYSSVEEFVTNQKIIRITTDQQPGLGNQAASASVMDRLRQFGFHGTFEFIYPDNVTDKITLLFDLPSNIPNDYYDEKQKVRFVKLSEHVNHLRNKSVEPYTLGLSGAFRKGPYDPIEDNNIDTTGISYLELHNFSNFLNSTVSVILDNYPTRLGESYIDVINESETRETFNNDHNFFTMPVADLNQAKTYLEKDPRGQELLKKKPALKTFIDSIENQSINVLSAYGWTLQKSSDGKYTESFPGNILQVLTGARYAQVKGPTKLRKPLIIAIYYS